MYRLRDQTRIFLIGCDLNRIIESKLSENVQVLNLLYNIRKIKLNVKQKSFLMIK